MEDDSRSSKSLSSEASDSEKKRKLPEVKIIPPENKDDIGEEVNSPAIFSEDGKSPVRQLPPKTNFSFGHARHLDVNSSNNNSNFSPASFCTNTNARGFLNVNFG